MEQQLHQTHHNSKKLVIIIIFLVITNLLSLIGMTIAVISYNRNPTLKEVEKVVYVEVTSTPNLAVESVANEKEWNTFKNDKYGVSFKYPKEAEINLKENTHCYNTNTSENLQPQCNIISVKLNDSYLDINLNGYEPNLYEFNRKTNIEYSINISDKTYSAFIEEECSFEGETGDIILKEPCNKILVYYEIDLDMPKSIYIIVDSKKDFNIQADKLKEILNTFEILQ